ncbi:hypothetical protein DFP73DRAFT_624314 [Morchella snyderi]|nr:hypothetical protein DFP73DRAFT_624314 [Morchella snyderi]
MTGSEQTTIEWFGATTYRLKTRGLTIFLDTWLDRPSMLPQYLSTSDVAEYDYIFTSHAHFDHLPGADKISLRTRATIVGNGEVINVMRAAGVPPSQLLPIAGGERIPLGTSGVVAHAYPSLHCLMPPVDHLSMPKTLDTGTVYLGGQDGCTLDVTRGMAKGFTHICNAPDETFANAPEGFKAFREWLNDREGNRFSYFDGGQIMYNFVIPYQGTLLWSGHLGAHEGVVKSMWPKPDVVILGVAGRGNFSAFSSKTAGMATCLFFLFFLFN